MQSVEANARLVIGGMTCVNCKEKIEKKLKATDGINNVIVSYNNGTADITYDSGKISLNKIIAVIEGLDYKVLKDKEEQKPDIIEIICILAIIVWLYIIIQATGILNLLVPSKLADTKMGYGMLFVLGLITSVHCIAMCGGINLSQCIPSVEHNLSGKKKSPSSFLAATAYNVGRVFSYTVIGFVLGLLGFLIGGNTELAISTFLQGILKMAAGLFMVIMGINMLGIFPWLRRFTIRMPKLIAQKIGNKRAGSKHPFLIGVLNGFMPCGPLQSMWIVALASGSPLAGALVMFCFSLGTVPLMLGLGFIVAALGKKFTDKVMTAGAVLVTVLGLAMLAQGGSLSGCISTDLLLVMLIVCCIAGVLISIPMKKKEWKNAISIVSVIIIIGSYVLWSNWDKLLENSMANSAEAVIVDGVQIVDSTLSSGSYPNITVYEGIPVKWVINAPDGSINGCNYKLLIRDYGIEYTFSPGENIIEFTPTKTGMVQYSCWMGMIRGNILVVDKNQ